MLNLLLWVLRICAPLTLAVMLAAPLLLDPLPEAETAANAHSPGVAIIPIGVGSDQYTFFRPSSPTFLVVEVLPDSVTVTESHTGMLMWLFFALLLGITTWWLWRRKTTSSNNSFKPNPLRGST